MKRFVLKQKSGFSVAKKYVSLMLVMLCSFIGVGFVSGAEIYEFFVRFKGFAFVGILLFFVLCFLFCRKILLVSNNNQIQKSNLEKINLKMQKNLKSNIKNTFYVKNYLKSIIVFLNVFLISAAMFSGLKNLIKNLFFNNYFLILILCFFFAFFLVLVGVRGLEKIDVFVVIFVTVILFYFIFDKSFNFITIFKFENEFVSKNIFLLFGSILFSALYVFMNILQFQPIVGQSGIIFSKKSASIFSLIFSLLLSLFLIIFVIFLSNNPWLTQDSMPFLKFFTKEGGFILKIFCFGLLICLLTTLITCLIGVKKMTMERFTLSNFSATSISVSACIVVSILPFNFFVSVIYPILGVLNFVVFVFL